MKFLLRNTIVYAFTLFLIPQFLPGLQIHGGLPILLIAGFVLTLMLLIIKPIINIITIPLNFATLGLFSIVTNLFVLYLLTVFVPEVSVRAFTFQGFSMLGFVFPKAHFGTFSAYAIIGVAVALLSSIFRWVVK